MPILGASNSAENKNMMSKIWTNGVQLSDSVENIIMSSFFFSHNVFKCCLLMMHQNKYLWSKSLNLGDIQFPIYFPNWKLLNTTTYSSLFLQLNQGTAEKGQ